jgi:hypothetical protein
MEQWNAGIMGSGKNGKVGYCKILLYRELR